MLNNLKKLGKLNKMRAQAVKLKKVLAKEEIMIEEGAIKIVVSADQKFKEVTVNGQTNNALINALNKAIKKSQKVSAQKMKNMDGGLAEMFNL